MLPGLSAWRQWLCGLLWLCVSAIAVLSAAQSAATDADHPAADSIAALIDEGSHERALAQVREALNDGEHPALWFEKSRALAQLEKIDAAAESLGQAVRLGYRDFSRMRTDSALVPLRSHETFKAIDEAARRAEPKRARQAKDEWIERFGRDDYRYEMDAERRLLYATALDDVAHDETRKMIGELADHLAATLFGALPDYEVLVAVPTPHDARRVITQESVGGLYQHDKRQLIAREIGSAMRHEFFHVMHYGHMERIGQVHPLWVQEGLASLYEDYEFDASGEIHFLPNERHTIARRQIRQGQAIPWRDFLRMPSQRFMARSVAVYPQARSIFEFVASRGQLERWYHTYVETFHDDPTGKTAFERTFDMSLNRIERDWVRWVRLRPDVPMHLEEGDASLGVETRPNASNDGVRITRILPGSAAAIGGLQVDDVIVSVNGQPTRRIEELRRVIGEHQVGDRVSIRIRRDGRHETRVMTLRALRL